MSTEEKHWNGFGKKTGGAHVTIELMECENGVWRMDGALRGAALQEESTFAVEVNGVRTAYKVRREDTDEAKTVGSKNDGAGDMKFSFELPLLQLGRCTEIRFLSVNAAKFPVEAVEYQAKLTDALKNSYWCFGTYMAAFRWNGSTACGLTIEKAGTAARILREAKLLKEILTASYGSKQMAAMRAVYWLARPFYKRKNIWITFDKLYKGGDCGEYFYKYLENCCGRKSQRITPVYVMRKDVPDYTRLVQAGYHPAAFRTMGQRLSYLYASMVFATHSGVPSFCGFNKWEVRFVQDLLRGVNTCIQHGLSVQDLTADSNRLINNNKRYYCASRYEIENLSQPSYDYKKEVLRLTGIPRYDGLVSDSKKQILIAPTWRSYLASPSVMGKERPYNPEFAGSDYFRIYCDLLKNEKLCETAQKYGYRILYLLHPVYQAQERDFENQDFSAAVRIATPLEISYEQALTESDLMVTDYSGVQFDFAYMRKPVVYFHPPKLPPHYEEGGFFCDTQGFGEICTQTEELVSLLCEYMEAGCRLKEFYRARQDDFFAYDDRENCRRIYEDAAAFQNAKKQM